MNKNEPKPPSHLGVAPGDERTEVVLGRVLRIGVLTAGAIVLAAGVAYFVSHAGDPASFSTFTGQPASLRSLTGIFKSLGTSHATGFIQFGLLVLIATPVLRVVLSVYSFARLRDMLYVVVTLIVLGVLAFGLLGGR